MDNDSKVFPVYDSKFHKQTLKGSKESLGDYGLRSFSNFSYGIKNVTGNNSSFVL